MQSLLRAEVVVQLAERHPGLLSHLAGRQARIPVGQQPAAGRLHDQRAGIGRSDVRHREILSFASVDRPTLTLLHRLAIHARTRSIDRLTRRGPLVHTPHQDRHDVVVVGGRVAGSATAMLLARLGHDVVVVDEGSFRDRHDLHARDCAQRGGPASPLGLARRGAGQRRAGHPRGHVQRRRRLDQPAVKDKAGVDLVVAPRRYVLDALLAAAAERAGADVRFGVGVTGVHRDDAWAGGRGRAAGPRRRGVRHQRPVRRRRGRRYGHGSPARSPPRSSRWPRLTAAAQYAYYSGIPWDGHRALRRASASFAGVFPTHDGRGMHLGVQPRHGRC